MASEQSALRPLTLPSLPPDVAHLSGLKLQLSQMQQAIEGFAQLRRKLETFTDEPTWNAYIPFGPLAYFSGQLVHTNDITPMLAPEGEAEPCVEGGKAGGEEQGQGRRVLRSAKQAREEAGKLQKDLEARIASLQEEIATEEEELRKKREGERKNGKAGLAGADMGDEDWTINERGEVINEEGLPMFDIREDLPSEPEPANPRTAPTLAASGSASASTASQRMRYLVKKGGKTVVRTVSKPSSTQTSKPAAPAAPALSSTTISSPPAPSKPPAVPAEDNNPFPIRPKLDIKAILDELEAEEKAEAEAEAKCTAAGETAGETAVEAAPALSAAASAGEPSEKAPISTAAPTPKPLHASGAFGGFAAGFLSKGKHKRPLNSLPTPPPAPASSTTAATTTRSPAPALKSSLSRPSSPSRSGTPSSEKKRVAFDLPPPSPSEDAPKPKKAPIILGMGDDGPSRRPDPPSSESKKPEGPFVRPIKDVVVEKPMKTVVPHAGVAGPGGIVRQKRLSRFRQMKEEAVESKADEAAAPAAETPAQVPIAHPVVSAVVEKTSKGKSKADDQADQPALIPAPVHTISLSARPSEPSKQADGTISYADIPFDSDEDVDEEDPDGSSDEEGFDWSDDDDEIDDEELDVDAALHAREVALAYHRQRLNVGGGRGTGPLGGYHDVGEGPFANVADPDAQGLVSADATIQSLDPSLANSEFGTYAHAGSAQLGKPSRFRLANRNLESAQLIIPSLLSQEPSLQMSSTPLGPARNRGQHYEADGLDDIEQERLRRTLEALAEGRPLPEDEQRLEREKEVLLREELAKEKEDRERARLEQVERDRTAGKRPPELVQKIPRRAEEVEPATMVPATPSASAPLGGVVERTGPSIPPAAPAASGSGEVAGEKPKRMSRFRQKQLGLVD
ncbi:uri1, prefoldin-like chaperone [Rhodotorula toruloides]